jgi:hypothetical protein
MRITPVTVFIAVFAVFIIAVVLFKIKKETIGIRSALVWLCLMSGVGFFGLFPEFLDWFIRIIHLEERILFVLLSAIFILLALIFNLNTRLDRMERNWAKTIQEMSLLTYRLEEKDKEHEQ